MWRPVVFTMRKVPSESVEADNVKPDEALFGGGSAGESQPAVEDMALVNAVNEAANRGESLSDIFILIARHTTRMFAGFAATIYLLSDDRTSLEVQHLNMPESIVGRIENDLGAKLPQRKIPLKPGTYYYNCLAEHSSRILTDHGDILAFLNDVIQADTPGKGSVLPMIDSMLGLRAVMMVPLVNAGQSIGLIDVASKQLFSPKDLERLQGIASQITAIVCRKQAEEQLRWERDLNSKLIKSAPVLFVTVDAGGCNAMINDAMLKLLGYERQEVLGKSFFTTFFVPEQQSGARAAFEELFKDRKPFSREWLMGGKDGTEHLVEWHVDSVNRDNGQLDYYFGVGIDLTERKKLQEQLIMADRLAAMGELVSGIAHELNNPLTGVLGFAELLLEKNIPENLSEDIAIIHHEAQRAAEVVKNMLAFARKHTSSKQNVNVNATIARVLSLRTYEQKVNNIKLTTRMSHELPDVLADVFQLQQVFLNIIINAEFFMKQAHNSGILTITTVKHGDKVRITISDNGPGIRPENINKIFDPFFTTKEVGVGTGLGLSLSHGIIKEHGGDIYAESKPGEGATFIIELPALTYKAGQDKGDGVFNYQAGAE